MIPSAQATLRRRPNWLPVPATSQTASALLGVATGGAAASALFVLLASATGGGMVVSEDAQAEPSRPLGLALAAAFVGIAVVLGRLALSVYRGHRGASWISAVLGSAWLISTVMDTVVRGGSALGMTTSLVPAVVLLACLASPTHRRYVQARGAQHRHLAQQTPAGIVADETPRTPGPLEP